MVVSSMSYATYERYKESGVDWLGEIPSDWELISLNRVSKVKSISNHPNERLLSVYLEKGVIPFEDVSEKRTNGTSDNLDKYQLVDIGDFVLNNQQAWRGSVGVSNYRGIISPAYIILEISDKLNSKFANYFFRSEKMIYQYVIHSKGVGTIQRNLYWQSFKNSLCWIPSLEEQTKIANFLDQKTAQIDQAIALKQQQIEKLNEYKQIVIQNAVTKGLNPNAPMKDSGVAWIGDIPEHWEIDKLKNILSSVSIKNHPNLPLLSITREKGVIERDIEDQESNHNFIPDDLSGYKLLKKGQFGMNKMKAWQGSYGVSDFTGIVSPAYYIFDINEKLDKNFFSLAIRSKFYVGYFASASDGVRIGQWDLNKTRMKEIPFIIPSIEEQKAIYEFSLTINQQVKDAIKKYQTQIDRLKEYKNILINQAVTGKIKI